jgi:kynurenine formamidase
MRIRSFIIAYALVLAILLFADRRPGSRQDNRYSHVVDLTGAPSLDRNGNAQSAATRLIAPAALIPGTWSAGQIPAERLVAPLVVVDLKASPQPSEQVTLDQIASWEERHGVIPQGSLVAIRRAGTTVSSAQGPFPITADAAQFLMEARYVLGFAIETPADLTSDRALARQLALHGDYVVAGATRFSSLPETGSLVIVAPIKDKNSAQAPVRVLAMVK